MAITCVERPLNCRHFVLAVDGPAGAGKSVVASRLARRLGWPLVDTGAIYRTVTLAALRASLDVADEQAVGELAWRLRVTIDRPRSLGFEYAVLCDGSDVTEQIFTEEIDRLVSVVAAYPKVRDALLPLQRNAVTGDSVVVGRDIGTVVFPDAKLKVYLDATPEVRAERRRRQMLERGIDREFSRVLADVMRRDGIDGGRSTAPMCAAGDAVVVDTNAIDIDEVVDRLEALVASRASADSLRCPSRASYR